MISRLFEPLVYPVGLVWAALIVGSIVFFRKKQRAAFGFASLLAAILTVFGCTPIPYLLLASLERPFVAATLANAPSADAVVVLGGQLKGSQYEAAGFTTGFGADRIATGVQALLSGKTARLVLGGGNVPTERGSFVEGERLKEFLTQWKSFPGEIIAMKPSANTHEEAIHFRSLANERRWTNVLLITSAYHLPRAVAAFEKAGVRVQPVGCDFKGIPALNYGHRGLRGFQWVPTTEPLAVVGLYIHEILGSIVYKMKEWT